MRHLAQVHVAEDVVEAVPEHRQPRVLGAGELLHDVVPVVVEVDTDHLVARHHDVLDRDRLEVEHAEQHPPVAFRQRAVRVDHHRAQLLLGQRRLAVRVGIDPEQPQQRVAHPVHHPDERVEQFQQRLVDPGRRERDALRVQRGQRLRRHLGEDQDHQGQRAGGDGDADLAEQAQRDHGRDRRGEDVDEVVADQDQADQPVWARQQAPRPRRTVMPLAREVAHAVAVQ